MDMLTKAAEYEKQMATAQALGAALDDLLRYQRVVTDLALIFPFPASTMLEQSMRLRHARHVLGMWWMPETPDQVDLWAAALLGNVVSGPEFLAWYGRFRDAARGLWL